MIESPLIRELLSEKACETAHRDILTVLETRFGDLPPDLAEDIESVVDEEQLKGLVRKAASCPDLDAFRSAVGRT